MSKAPEKQILAWLSRSHIRPYLIALISTFLIFIQSYIDPFGLVSAAYRTSGLLYSKIISPFYGGRQHKGRDNILVVLYDKAYFRENSKTDTLSTHWSNWPLPVKHHELLVERIASANPAAILLAVYFSIDNYEREENVAHLYRQLKALDCADGMEKNRCEEESLAPIYVAGVLSDPQPKSLGQIPPRTALVEQPVQPFFYQLQVCKRNNSDQCIDTPMTTAAYDLYQHWCARQHRRVPKSCKQLAEANSNKTLFLQWGYAPSDDMREIIQAGKTSLMSARDESACQRRTQGLATLIETIKFLFRGVMGHKEPALCAYHDVLSAQIIKHMSFNDLSVAVKDKVVLIGATDYPLADTIESYVHGYIPSVFWHAAALDNLIEAPNHFSRKLEKNINIGLEVMSALLLYIFMAQFVHQNKLTQARLVSWQELSKDAASVQHQSMINLQLLTIFIAVCLLSLVLNLVWVTRGYAPESWVSTAGLLFLLCSEQIVAANSFFSRLSQSFANYTAQPLAAILQKSDYLARCYLGRFNPYKLSHYFVFCLLWLERVFTYLFMWSLFFISFIAIGFFVCFVPVVYFSVNKTTGIELYGFALVYITFILLALYFWSKGTLSLRQSEQDNKYLFFIKRKLLK